MSRRLPYFVRAIKGVPLELPPAVEKIARNSDVFKMLENGLELDTVSFDNNEHPTEAIFVFGNDACVRLKRCKKKP